MSDWINKIDTLDLSVFEAIPSQTSPGDRRSLLAVQRAVARKHKEYVYLEIGSHLGGSLQPHLGDNRCKRIYSIDPRPSQQPDDRSPGHVAFYENNSTKRMLEMLDSLGCGDVSKIECFDLDAPRVDPKRIISSPQLAFIDGEHTKAAAISDFKFCAKVISDDGVILFHDFAIIYPAIPKILGQLDKQGRAYQTAKLEDNVFAIFLDPDVLASDPYLALQHERNRIFWPAFLLKKWLTRSLPNPLVKLIWNVRDMLRKNAA
jgi:hypothetical protein